MGLLTQTTKPAKEVLGVQASVQNHRVGAP